ncbi:hypothetical protein AMS68_003581 [Peltaster fructicola]|uniref:Extracellular membrane protein CFEM domain-containing protein n=1 Tax=Peltaster fructicola TaxID=286661 RepID=A0A6H0XTK5_9PEZI|nr:hypothetical protein AMS68_003581 [Peltaster fructicola]
MHRHSVLASLLAAVAAQHTQDPKLCVIGSPVTTFKDCHALDSYIESCGKYASTSDATKYYNCYCQQDYVNAIYGTKSACVSQILFSTLISVVLPLPGALCALRSSITNRQCP